MAEWAAIFGGSGAALVTGVFTVMLAKLRRDNTAQHETAMQRREQGHQENMELRMAAKQQLDDMSGRLNEIRDDVREVREHYATSARVEEVGQRVDQVRSDMKEVRRRQDDHLEWHSEQ